MDLVARPATQIAFQREHRACATWPSRSRRAGCSAVFGTPPDDAGAHRRSPRRRWHPHRDPRRRPAARAVRRRRRPLREAALALRARRDRSRSPRTPPGAAHPRPRARRRARRGRHGARLGRAVPLAGGAPPVRPRPRASSSAARSGPSSTPRRALSLGPLTLPFQLAASCCSSSSTAPTRSSRASHTITADGAARRAARPPWRPPPPICGRRCRRAHARRSSARRRPTSATTRPTRRCCSRPLLGEKPRDVAERLGEAVAGAARPTGSRKVDVAGPGFLNLFLADAWYADALGGVLDAGDALRRRRAPRSPSGSTSSSSPPTRPGRSTSATRATPPTATRSAGCWPSTATTSRASSTSTTPASQIAQVRRGDPGAGARRGARGVPRRVRHRASRDRSPARPRMDLDDLGRPAWSSCSRGCRRRWRASGSQPFDVWFSERSLYAGHPPRSSTRSTRSSELGQTYRAEDALWLRTTDFGDDKDRVLVKSDGALHLLRAGHRLPPGQARARLRPADRRLGRRPPRLRRAR